MNEIHTSMFLASLDANTVLVADVSSRSSRTRSYVWTQVTGVNWREREWKGTCTRPCWIDAAKWRL